MLVRLTVNFDSYATYKHCATEANYPEYRKTPPIKI
jgi:hypothetical protein